jgi:hypothetical protein
MGRVSLHTPQPLGSCKVRKIPKKSKSKEKPSKMSLTVGAPDLYRSDLQDINFEASPESCIRSWAKPQTSQHSGDDQFDEDDGSRRK